MSDVDWWRVADWMIIPVWLAWVGAFGWMLVCLLERVVASDPDNQRRWREIERRQKALDEADRHMAGRGE